MAFLSTPSPEELSLLPEVASLGPQTEEFRPATANIFAGLVIAFLLAIGAIAAFSLSLHLLVKARFNLPLFDDNKLSWFAVGAIILLASAMTILGMEFLLRVRGLAAFRLYLCTTGFYVVRNQNINVFHWDEISEIIEEHVPDRVHLQHQVKLQVGTSKRYVITRQDGHQETIDGNSIRRLIRFSQMLRAEAETRGIPWQVEEKSK